MKKVYVICHSYMQFYRFKMHEGDTDVELIHVTGTVMLRGLKNGFMAVKLERCYSHISPQAIDEYELIVSQSAAQVYSERSFKVIKPWQL